MISRPPLAGRSWPATKAASLPGSRTPSRATVCPPERGWRSTATTSSTRLTGVLEATYPVVTRLVHERFLAYAADQYIRACPPAGPCLFEYGASFPDFLEALPPCRPLPYLPDVARLEWALHRARHADDVTAIDPAILRDLGIDAVVGATFRLHPAVSLLASPWPIDDIWRANQPEADPDLTVDLDRGGVQLEVRRDGDDAVFRALDAASHACRLRLGRGPHPRGGGGGRPGGGLLVRPGGRPAGAVRGPHRR